MAIDEQLLREADRTGAAFLRLYRWDPPCLSFGRNEPALARYDRAAIERFGIAVVRRPTGGRAVWHEHELTYAVAAPIAAFGSLRASYRAIHDRLAAALRALGVDAVLASDRPPVRMADPGACFAAPVGGEVLIAGRKVVGSAQVRHGTALLQHGSILLDGTQDIVEQLRRDAAEPRLQPGKREAAAATTLSAALGRAVSFDEVATAIIKVWGVGTLTASDRPRPGRSVFSSPEWTWRR